MADVPTPVLQSDSVVLHPLLCALRVAYAAACAAQLRVGPDTSRAAGAAVDAAESVLHMLLENLDHSHIRPRPSFCYASSREYPH